MRRVKIVVISFLLLISVFAVEAAASLEGINKVSDLELMNNNLTIDSDYSRFTFDYGVLEGTTFQHASGLVIVTNIEGNDITLDLDLNIFFITGDILDEIEIPEGINISHNLVN